MTLSNHERELIAAYRILDPYNKVMLCKALGIKSNEHLILFPRQRAKNSRGRSTSPTTANTNAIKHESDCRMIITCPAVAFKRK